MATSKPQINETDIWAKTATAADKAKPAQTQVDNGWIFGQTPPFQVFNWFKNIYSQMLVHIQENGVPAWSADISYQEGALTKHGTSIWQANADNINRQPGIAPEWAQASFKGSSLPIGSIVAYAGSSGAIPVGWVVANGANGTIDMSDRFILGTGSAGAIGSTGGYSDSQLKAHTHGVTVNSGGGHSHTANHNHTASSNTTGAHTHTATFNFYDSLAGPNSDATIDARDNNMIVNNTMPTSSAGSHKHTITVNTKNMNTSSVANHSHSATIASAGITATGRNLPPFVKLLYIQKIA